VNDRDRCCERHRRWLLAVALLAGGAGIGLGSVLAALLADRGLSALVWVSAFGRLVATTGIVFAWSSLEAQPLTVRVLRTRLDRLASAYRRRRTRGDGPLSRPKRARSAVRVFRYRSLAAELRSRSKGRGRRRRRKGDSLGSRRRRHAARLRHAIARTVGRRSRIRPESRFRSVRNRFRFRSGGRSSVRERVGTLLSQASIGRV